jgi:hypothetical protein
MIENSGNMVGAAGTTVNNSGSAFTRFINWCLALLVFVSPLVYLPFTAEVLEFNKQSFIFLMVMVILGVWVVRILTTRSVSWVKTPLDFVLLAYLGVYLITSFTALDQVSSFLGYYGRFVGSFMSVMSLVVLYYILVNNVRTERVTSKLIDVLMLSGAVVLVYSLLQIFGVYLLRFNFAKSPSFNPVGSMVTLSIFAGVMILLAQWGWLKGASKMKSLLYALITVVGLLVVFFINAFVAWLVLALSMIAFVAMSMVMSRHEGHTGVWKPLLVLVISVLFVGFNFLPDSINPRRMVGDMVRLPVEIQLSNSATWEMVRNAVKNEPLLGYGPGNTAVAFGQIKPDSINQSIVWQLNFDRASSEIANITIETGLLGLLAFEALAVLFFIYAILFLMKRPDHPGRIYAFGLLIAWLALYLTHFFYFYNTTLWFLFWLLLGLFVAVTHWKQEGSAASNLSFNESPRSAVSWMFASLLILAVLLIGGFFQIAVYYADTAYAAGVRELNSQDRDLMEAAGKLSSAIRSNQYRDTYYLAYGQNLVFLAAQEARSENPDISRFQGYVRDMVAAGNSATSISPNKATNWSARVAFFNQIRALPIAGADDVIITSAKNAVERDPKNPVYHMQLAQAYINAAESIDPSIVAGGKDTDADGLSDQAETDLGSNPQNSDSNANGISDGDELKAGFNPAGTERLSSAQLQAYTKVDQDKLRLAEESMKKAIELKANLPDVYISLGRLYEKWGKLPDAERTLHDGARILPSNVNIAFELGRVKFNLKNYADAEKLFNQVVKVVPNHANAHYSLALVAVQRNDTARAIAELNKVLEITGPNQTVENLIQQLENPSPAASE